MGQGHALLKWWLVYLMCNWDCCVRVTEASVNYSQGILCYGGMLCDVVQCRAL